MIITLLSSIIIWVGSQIRFSLWSYYEVVPGILRTGMALPEAENLDSEEGGRVAGFRSFFPREF